MNSKAKTGSMDEEQPAMRAMVPVGAMVRTVAFRRSVPLKTDLATLGKLPLRRPSSRLSASARSLMKPMRSPAKAGASGES